jgi:hypothetical protein
MNSSEPRIVHFPASALIKTDLIAVLVVPHVRTVAEPFVMLSLVVVAAAPHPYPQPIAKPQHQSVAMALTNPKLFFCRSMKLALPCQTLQRFLINARVLTLGCY